MRTFHDMLFYKIENPYAEDYAKRNKGKNHGFGLQNVKRCVEKYNGDMLIEKDDRLFKLSLHLNIGIWYEERLENERIEQHDELKTKIRDRAGRYTYSLGLLVICFSILIFGILGALKVIDNARMIVLYLSGYLLFQVIAGIVIFNKLMKKY